MAKTNVGEETMVARVRNPSRSAAMLWGAGLVLDLGGTSARDPRFLPRERRSPADDAAALRRDWDAVAADFTRAVESVARTRAGR